VTANTKVATLPKRNNLTAKFAERFSVDENEVMDILKSTAFKQREGQPPPTDAQVTALMIVADQYGLNPWTKEIYAYPDKNNGIVPVVGVDGWSRIMNSHPQMDGIDFRYSEATLTHKGKLAYEWIECVITRKDRTKPIVVREYFDEVVRTLNFATPWDTHPKRLHRHKSEIQCARVAFGFAGIYDEDEAQRIIEKDITPESTANNASAYVAPDYYSDEEFAANEPAWRKVIDNGKEPDRFISFIEANGKLFTEVQKKTITSWKKAPATIDGEATQVEDDFVKDLKDNEVTA